MLIGFEHVGLAVGDLDESIAFYCDLLGLKLVLRKMAPGGDTEMAFLDAGGGQLELAAPNRKLRPATDIPPDQAGIRHVTFAFDDIGPVFDCLMQAGVTPVEKPRAAANREVIACMAFVRDPDGIIVELVQRAPGRA
jgi:glyoxylase I family protein